MADAAGSWALEAEAVTAGYVRDLPILHGVSLRAARGALTCIIGPNGAGKSTLVKAIAGLVPVSAGSVRHDGADITRLAPDRLAAHGIAYLPQTDNVFRSLTVAQNLALAARRAGTDPAPLYDRFPLLAEKRRDRAASLSGGQRQTLAFAMALAGDPRTILLDEPSAGLSPRAAQEVLDLARALTSEGVTIILVEQNVKQALARADHCYILAEGRNQIDGPSQTLLDDPIVGEIYLGGRRMRA